MKTIEIPLKGLSKNGEHVLFDITFNRSRVRLTSNLKFPSELETAHRIRDGLILALEQNKFEIRNFSLYFKNLQSLEKYDEKFYKNKISPTMDKLFEESLSIMKEEVKRNEITDEYRDVHIYAIKNHLNPFFGNIKVTKVSVLVIQEFLSSLDPDYTKETVKGILKPLNKALSLAVSKGLIQISPMKAMPYNKLSKFKSNYEKNTNTLSLKQVMTIINATDNISIKNTIAFLFWSSCRPCEVFALCVNDIDLDKSVIYVYKSKTRKQNIKPPKNGESRVVQIFPPLIPFLESQLEICRTQADKTLFKAPGGKPWRHSSHFGKYWKQILDKLKDEMEYKNLYKLRSACITYLSAKKVPIGKISKFAGHKRKATTQRYDQFTTEDTEKIVLEDIEIQRHNYDVNNPK